MLKTPQGFFCYDTDMKVFVSGQIRDLDNVRSVQQKLVNAGHTVTHDWTRNETGDKMLSTSADKLRDLEETGKRARLDIQGVIDADVYVACTDNENPGKGMYVELGAALSLAETIGTPRIYLVGELNHMSVFYFHPKVIRVEAIEDVIVQLQS